MRFTTALIVAFLLVMSAALGSVIYENQLPADFYQTTATSVEFNMSVLTSGSGNNLPTDLYLTDGYNESIFTKNASVFCMSNVSCTSTVTAFHTGFFQWYFITGGSATKPTITGTVVGAINSSQGHILNFTYTRNATVERCQPSLTVTNTTTTLPLKNITTSINAVCNLTATNDSQYVTITGQGYGIHEYITVGWGNASTLIGITQNATTRGTQINLTSTTRWFEILDAGNDTTFSWNNDTGSAMMELGKNTGNLWIRGNLNYSSMVGSSGTFSTLSTGTLAATGNVSGGNVSAFGKLVGGLLQVFGSATIGNLTLSDLLSAGHALFSGDVNVTGDVIANKFYGQYDWLETSSYLTFNGTHLAFSSDDANMTGVAAMTYLEAYSGYWNNSYAIVDAMDASWNNTYDVVNANDGNWNNTYDVVNANDANWNYTFSYVFANDDNWNYSYNYLLASDDNWNYSYSYLLAQSGNWNYSYTYLLAQDDNWNHTYDLVNGNHANWNNTYDVVNANDANWNNTYDVVEANDGNWNNSYNWTSTRQDDWEDAVEKVANGNLALNWTQLQNYPAACPANSSITTVGDTITCTDSWINSYGDDVTGNFSITGFVRIVPRTGAIPCAAGDTGALFYNATSSHLYVCDGANMRQLDN